MSRIFRLAVTAADRTNPEKTCLDSIYEAGDRGADMILLPEEPDIVASRPPGEHRMEDHPLFQAFRKAAAQKNIAVVGSLSVKVDEGVANTGFFLDRSGDLQGIYRKKHPAPSEEYIVTTPVSGDPFPLFEFEDVKFGMAICMDIHVPEMFRIYGLKGAHIVLVPTMYLDYTGDMLESIEKARAIDSQMYLALSRYLELPYLAGKSMGYAKVIAPDGRIIVSTAHRPGIGIAEFDPEWRMPFWGDGYRDMREIYDKIRRPDFYGDLVKPKSEEGTT
ncbi:MAG TPA: carbon-nitrogen hydrolase family protein [bacterium]|nr:carbon-nitrogen hydrolase family protein [bacterium]HQL62519.1 carbon-nitrogen hydrolase family protein [bacterium]